MKSMHSRMAALAAILTLATAGAAQAQGVPVQSELTLALRVERTNPSGNDLADGSTRIRRLSFSTKDLRDLVSDLLHRNDVRSIGVRRMSLPTEDTSNSEIFRESLVLLDRRGNAIDAGSGNTAVAAKVLDLTLLSPLFASSALQIRDNDRRGVLSQQERALEAVELSITGDGSNLRFALIGVNDADAKRRFQRRQDLGLLFGRRTLDVSGGAQIDAIPGDRTDDLVGNGVVSGTIKATAEKRTDR
jgi:hypothetical protein